MTSTVVRGYEYLPPPVIGRDGKYDPWLHFSSFDGWRLETLPEAALARKVTRAGLPWQSSIGATEWAVKTIWMASGLCEADVRSTLAHECVHVMRGPFGAAVLDAEEDHVDRQAARWLITTDALTAALRATDDVVELADLFRVGPEMVDARLDGLTKEEQAQIRAALSR